MEDTLRVNAMNNFSVTGYSLNPCFNGRYSQSTGYICKDAEVKVLILVLMEDTLRACKHAFLNPLMPVS